MSISDAVLQLFDPADLSTTTSAQRLEILNWAAKRCPKFGRPLGERYVSTEQQPNRFVDPTLVSYLDDLEATTPVTEIHTLLKQRGRTTIVLLTDDGKWVVEKITYGEDQKLYYNGLPYFRRDATSCSVSTSSPSLQKALGDNVTLTGTIARKLLDMVETEAVGAQLKLSAVQERQMDLCRLVERLPI